MLRIEFRRYMYFAPYLSHALCHPSTGVPVCLFRFPGVSPLTRLHRRATLYRPCRGSDFGGHSPVGYPLQIAIWRVFRGPPIIIHQSQLLVVEFTAPLNRLGDVAGSDDGAKGGVGVGGADVAGGTEDLAHVFGEVEAVGVVGVPGAVFIKLRDEEIIRALISGQEKNIALISRKCYFNLEL